MPSARDHGVADLHRLVVDVDLALVAHQRAAQNIHQRGFAGAVFAHQGQHLAAVQLKADVVERPDLAEALADALHFQELAHVASPFIRYSVKPL